MLIWQPNQTVKNGRFLIEKTLGGGGFGITYLAREVASGKQVVIKTLNAGKQSARNFKEIQEKFVNEALTLKQFRHSQIVQVKELIQEGELWGIVMEYIDGIELHHHVIEKGNLKESEALNYINQISIALEYVHQQGVLHRDVKPSNIMLRQGGQNVVLIDFGLAREFIDGISLSMTNCVTQGYAPPEQYKRHGKFAEYTDVYALSATLYYLLTGKTPIPANFRQQHNIKLTEPVTYNSAISERVNNTIMQGLTLETEQRPQNMAEFRKLLGLVPRQIPISVSSQSAVSNPFVKKSITKEKAVEHKIAILFEITFIFFLGILGFGLICTVVSGIIIAPWSTISWIILGVIAGAIAKMIIPGRQGGGFWQTAALGITGSFIGGAAHNLIKYNSLTTNAQPSMGSISLAMVGSTIVIFLWGLVLGRAEN
jgi:serine/threonine protein kinase